MDKQNLHVELSHFRCDLMFTKRYANYNEHILQFEKYTYLG